VVLTLPSWSNALPSHTAIPKVGSRTPTIVSDAYSSYSRFPAVVLTLIVPLLLSPSIAAVAIHRCRRRPMHFPVIRQSLRLEAELLQLYQTFLLVAASLLSLSNALSSHLAILNVSSRTPTIVSDAYSSYSRFPVAALALVVPLLPLLSITAIAIHRCRCCPLLLLLSIAAVAVHHCGRHPSLPSLSNAPTSHSAIPKVGSRTPTIVPDAHGSYSRFPTVALTLVVPSLPSP